MRRQRSRHVIGADTRYMGQFGLRNRATCAAQSIVTLQDFEWEHAFSVGIARHRANWKKKDTKNYLEGREAGRIQPESIAGPRSACTENAVAIWTNQYWSASAWYPGDHASHKNKADVGINIEVRSIVAEHHGAKVHRHQLKQGLTLWVGYAIPDEYYQVRMMGWLPHDLAWKLGKPVSYGTTQVADGEETDRSVATTLLYHPLHTEASIKQTQDPTQPPTHQGGCLCRVCTGRIAHLHLPNF